MPRTSFAGGALVAALALVASSVPAEARGVTGRGALDLVRGAVVAQYQVAEQDVDVRALLPDLPSLLPSAPESSELRLAGPIRQLGPAVPVPFDLVAADGRKLKSVVPRFAIEAWRRVPVMARPVGTGQILGPGDMEIRRLPQSRLPFDFLPDEAQLVGARMLRGAASGSPLVASQVDLPPVVHRGGAVRVRVHKGDLEVLGQGLAMQDGRVGQLIRVQNPLSHKDFMARVRDPDVVEVDIGEEGE